MPSRSGTLNSTDIKNWSTNLLIFIAPIVMLYITGVLGIIQLHGHVITLTDFIPNNVSLIGMLVYLLNAVLDLFRKLIEGY